MKLIEHDTLTVRDVATDASAVPMIGDSTISLAGFKCDLVYEDADYRVYRVVGCSHTSGSNASQLSTGVRVYKRSLVIGSWLLECWTHGIDGNPQMDERFGPWFKRRTAPEPAKKTTKRNVTRMGDASDRPAYPTYAKQRPDPYSPYSAPKPRPVERDELDGFVSDKMAERVVKSL